MERRRNSVGWGDDEALLLPDPDKKSRSRTPRPRTTVVKNPDGTVVETIKSQPVTERFHELQRKLYAAVDPDDVHAVRKASSTASREAYEAGCLLDLAEYEYRKLKDDRSTEFATWHMEGIKFWADQKSKDKNTKPCSDKMAEEYPATMYGDRLREVQGEIQEARTTRDNAEKLYEALRDRARHLRAILESHRGSVAQSASREAGRGDD